MPKKLLLIDGTAQLYRAFYGIQPLTDPRGRPVNAVYGFVRTLMNLLETFKPTHAIVLFDRPEPTHRHEVFPDYKAQREAAPEDFQAQIPLVKGLLKAWQVVVCEQAGLEADDLIGTLAHRAEKDKFQVLMYSNDKDLYQLVGKNTRMIRPLRGGQKEYDVLDAQSVEQAFGVAPQQVVDVLALAGDASDNVPGVPGVGNKTAVQLIKDYGSFDKLYASLKKITKEKLREKLETNRKQAEQSRELVTIRLDADIDLTWDACPAPLPIPDAAYAYMADLGFKRLLINRGKSAALPTAAWAAGLDSQAEPAAVLAEAKAQGKIAVDLLSEGIALSANPRAAAWIPLDGHDLDSLLSRMPELTEMLADAHVTKVGYDLKPLAKSLRQAGQTLQGPYEDLHLAAHLLDLPANRPADFVARLLGGPPPAEQPALLTCAMLLISGSIPRKLKSLQADNIYREIELPLMPILADMEAEGVAIDVRALEDMSSELGREMQSLEKEIYELAGSEFNLRSTQQLAEVLFDHLGLAPGKKTKTGRSTGVDVLENLATAHPVPRKILDYRQLQKLKSTYLDVLPGLIDPGDRRVHTTFHQVGAATGRLSSSDPNLQNIPIRTERGRRLRKMFVPGRPGHKLLSADYSQIELRILAHLSEDEQMITDFEQGLDIHQATASNIFNVALDAVTPEMRRQAKTCNFGIAYGVSPYGLARQLRIGPQQAKGFIDGFYGRYPRVREYLDQVIEQARESGYVSTFLGRRRSTPDVNSANRNIREAGERMAINTPIQGAAADIIKKAMVTLGHELAAESWKSRMILQVHDELLFEGPAQEMPELQKLVTRIMSQVTPLTVKLVVDSAWGDNWMAAHA